MSADGWSICPRCHAEAQQVEKLEETLREDFEFCLDEAGRFYCSYEASCQKCTFTYRFVHEEQLTTVL